MQHQHFKQIRNRDATENCISWSINQTLEFLDCEQLPIIPLTQNNKRLYLAKLNRIKSHCHWNRKDTLADLEPFFFTPVSSSGGARNGSCAGQRSTYRACTSLLKEISTAEQFPGKRYRVRWIYDEKMNPWISISRPASFIIVLVYFLHLSDCMHQKTNLCLT